MNCPSYLKLSAVCRMFGLNYSATYADRLEPHQKRALEAYFKAVESVTAEFFDTNNLPAGTYPEGPF